MRFRRCREQGERVGRETRSQTIQPKSYETSEIINQKRETNQELAEDSKI
jgi:hypothetical protein